MRVEIEVYGLVRSQRGLPLHSARCRNFAGCYGRRVKTEDQKGFRRVFVVSRKEMLFVGPCPTKVFGYAFVLDLIILFNS